MDTLRQACGPSANAWFFPWFCIPRPNAFTGYCEIAYESNVEIGIVPILRLDASNGGQVGWTMCTTHIKDVACHAPVQMSVTIS